MKHEIYLAFVFLKPFWLNHKGEINEKNVNAKNIVDIFNPSLSSPISKYGNDKRSQCRRYGLPRGSGGHYIRELWRYVGEWM